MNGMSPERFAYLGLAQSLANQGRRDLTADEKADIAAINAPSDLLADLPFIEVKDEAAMSDRPIIFSAPMIRALLDGRKSMTRRILKPQPPEWVTRMCHEGRNGWIGSGDGHGTLMHVPYAVGDRLWVREQCATWGGTIRNVVYRADETAGEWDNIRDDAALGHWKLRSSIHMPRWASRLTLTLTDVRVQRLQEISEVDAIAEGVNSDTDGWFDYLMPATQCCASPQDSYATLWNSLHGPDAWAANPWVAALSFKTHRCNIDNLPGGNHE